MLWLKNVIVDLIVTAVIALMVTQGWPWTEILVWVYTPLALLLRIVALFAGRLARLTEAKHPAPRWFYHLLYAVNVAMLLAGTEWILAGGWVLIWSLSAYSDRSI